ncbi:MAG: hypothetical protein LBG44_05560 [Gemmatimonadota bacterium]|nr:hypothetical protein [Gemmatimonadota bacterium]
MPASAAGNDGSFRDSENFEDGFDDDLSDEFDAGLGDNPFLSLGDIGREGHYRGDGSSPPDPPRKRQLPPDEEPGVNQYAQRARDEVRRRASGSVQRGFEQLADRIDEIAEHISRLAGERIINAGPGERAASAASSTAGWLSDASEYLREGDIDTLREDLESQVRQHPIRSIVIAVSAGWLVGKILR